MTISLNEGAPARPSGPGQIPAALRKLADVLGMPPRRLIAEIALVGAVCLIAAGWALYLFSHFEFERVCRGFDLWFDSDPARTVANITIRWAEFHNRANLHPLYSLFVAGPFGFLVGGLGVAPSTVTTLYIATQSALFAGAAFIAMRAFGLPRIDALLGLLLLYSTAASLYWLGFPEWTAWGAAAVMVSIIWVAGPKAIRNNITGAGQNMISASIVVTSWPIGVLASLISNWPKRNWRSAFTHTWDALALMAALSVIQYLIFPTASAFLNIWPEVFHTAGRVAVADASLLTQTYDFFVHTLVAPQPAVLTEVPEIAPWGTPVMVAQGQGTIATPLAAVALTLWAAMLTFGFYTALRGGVRPATLIIVAGALVYFYALHMVFGGEIFLFSLHFAPLLTFVAVWSLRSRRRLIARGLCVALIAVSFAANTPAFQVAAETHNGIDRVWLARAAGASQNAMQMDCR